MHTVVFFSYEDTKTNIEIVSIVLNIIELAA